MNQLITMIDGGLGPARARVEHVAGEHLPGDDRGHRDQTDAGDPERGVRERAEKRAMPCKASRCMLIPSRKVAGRRRRPAPRAYSVAWMSSTSFFISGVAAYFS